MPKLIDLTGKRFGRLTVINRAEDHTSGIKGVTWDKFYNKWNAYITVNYKKINLGYFINLEDAIKIRKEAEEKYFGEYSYDNSINKK